MFLKRMYAGAPCFDHYQDFAVADDDEGFAGHAVAEMIVVDICYPELAACISDDGPHSALRVVPVDSQNCTLKNEYEKTFATRAISRVMGCH